MPALSLQGEARTTIACPPWAAFALVSHITRTGEWSPERFRAAWLLAATGPAVGAQFQGCNRLTLLGTWCSTATVTVFDPAREFSFVVGNDPDRPNTESSWLLEPALDGQTVLT